MCSHEKPGETETHPASFKNKIVQDAAILSVALVKKSIEWTSRKKTARASRLILPAGENLCLFQDGHPSSFCLDNSIAVRNSIE
jgi:hypothetical protein